jgi:hypothetical protein
MNLRLHASLLAGLSCAALATTGCDNLAEILRFGLPGLGSAAQVAGAGSVQLTLRNFSGAPVEADVSFLLGGQEVRHTRRRLTADGPASRAELLQTVVDTLRIKAVVDSGVTAGGTAAALQPGQVLVDTSLHWNIHFQDGQRLDFDIHAPTPPPQIVDCNGNGVSDPLDIQAGTSADCNGNGIPDSCDVAPGGASQDCNCNAIPDSCDLASGRSQDRDGTGVPDECERCETLDIVFVMDTSGSMVNEALGLCPAMSGLTAELAARGLTARTALLGITSIRGGNFSCLTDSVANLLGAEVPGAPPCCPMLETVEDWGPAVAVVAARYPWQPGALRIIVPISDEGARRGDPCLDPGDDRDAVTHAIAVAAANLVTVAPIFAAGDEVNTPCVAGLAEALAGGTGGIVMPASVSAQALAGHIAALHESSCSVNQCD